MKYAHTWRIDQGTQEEEEAAFGATIADATRIIDLLNNGGVPIMGPAGWGNVQMDGSRIALNGYVEFSDAHEPFTFDLGRYTVEYVDTAHNNYDVAVTSILLRAKYHYGDRMLLASDGTWRGGWHAARTLCLGLFDDEASRRWMDDNDGPLVSIKVVGVPTPE